MSQIIFSNRADDEGQWISVSDLMAGLMMVFLFIAIIYSKEAEERYDNVTEMAKEWRAGEEEIYRALEREFRDDLDRWEAEIDKQSLTIRFLSPTVLFDDGQKDVSKKFKEILDDFIPRYIELLFTRFADNIDEIRIEGHTSSGFYDVNDDKKAFIGNMDLSQARTRAVLDYSLNIPSVGEFSPWMIKTVGAHGLSSARLIYRDGKEDPERSRRVEFTIKTKTKEAMFKILEKVAPSVEKSF
jgi:outer membrane protein OmpA-like peptidoglycan-associated protein